MNEIKNNIIIPQPIPYQGSKRKLSSTILGFFPDYVETLIEPFSGSAAVSLAAIAMNRVNSVIINDINKPLIDLWRKIAEHPKEISIEYEKLWRRQLDNPQVFYKKVRKMFNKTGRPDYFLYLLARCVKASVRYNSNGEFNQSPDNRRLGARPNTMRKNIMDVSLLLKKRVSFSSKNYQDILGDVGKNDLIYMDPPYQGVCGDGDNRYYSGIKYPEFIGLLKMLNKKSIKYIVSYDGRTGNKTFGKSLPKYLNLEHIELCAGKSTQATLLGRKDITYESLYLSPVLKESICKKEKKQERNVNDNIIFMEGI